MVSMSVSPEGLACAESDRGTVERIGVGVPERGFLVLRLSAIDGSRVVELYQSEAIVGRHSQADIRIASRDVSRHHCRLVFADGQWYVEDLGSLNGTYVNDQAVTRAPLLPNSVLRVAGHAFLVSWPQLDSTVDCPAEDVRSGASDVSPPCCAAELPGSRARQVLESIAEQLPEQPAP